MDRTLQKSASQRTRSSDVEPLVADRKLPQSLEAEQYVIGAILLDPSVAPGLMDLLTENDFYSTRHRRIFQSIQTLYDEFATVDPILVRDHLVQRGVDQDTGGMDYLESTMATVQTVANAEYHARQVRDKSTLRHLITTCTGIVQGAYESEEGAPLQLDSAEQRILEIGASGESSDFVQIQQVIDHHFEELDRNKGRLEGVLSGFRDLDELTTGLHPSEFVIVAGRPSMGKTTFCMNIVERVARENHGVAVFSLEVSREQLVQNLLCSAAEVDAQDFRKNKLSSAQWNDVTLSAERLRDMKIYIDDTTGLTPLTVKAKARRLHARSPFDLLIIDYLQLMEGGESGESRQQEVSKISRNLKGLARELKIPVIAISQLSRGVENRESHRPRLADLRESGAIEQDADLVLLLYREEYYQPDREECKGKAEVIVAKQRNGPTGSVHFAFRGQYLRFDDLARGMEY